MSRKRVSIDDLMKAADAGDARAEAAVADLMAEAYAEHGPDGLDDIAATPNPGGRKSNARRLVERYGAEGFASMADKADNLEKPGGLPVELSKDDWNDAYEAVGDLVSWVFDVPGIAGSYLKSFSSYAYGWGKKYFRVGAAWVHHSILIYKGAAGIADQFRQKRKLEEKNKDGGPNSQAG